MNQAILELRKQAYFCSLDESLHDNVVHYKRAIRQIKDRKASPNFVAKDHLDDCLADIAVSLIVLPDTADNHSAISRLQLKKLQIKEALKYLTFKNKANERR